MGTITDKLNKLAETKSAIKTAIVNKGVAVSDSDTFASYANKIASISGGGSAYEFDFTVLGYDEEECREANEIANIMIASGYTVEDINRSIDYSVQLYTGSGTDFINSNNIQAYFYPKESGNLDLSSFSGKYIPKVSYRSNNFSSASSLIKIGNPVNSDTFSSFSFGDCYSLIDIPQLDTSNFTRFSYMFDNCTSLNVNKEVIFNATKATDFSNMFRRSGYIKKVTFTNTSGVTDFDYMFYYSRVNEVSGIDFTNRKVPSNANGLPFSWSYIQTISNVKTPEDAVYLFRGAKNLKNIYNLDTSNTTNFDEMFYECRGLQQISEIDTSKGTKFSYMFYRCYNITSIPQLDTSSGTNFGDMFEECKALESIPELNTSSGTNFSNMFYSCTSLKSASLPDTSKGTNFNEMFSNCNSLESASLLNTSSGTNFNRMFFNCSSLNSIILQNTSSGTNFSHMFYSCSSLTSIPQLDTSSGTDLSSMFYGCKKLNKITGISLKSLNTNINYTYFNYYTEAPSIRFALFKDFGTGSSCTSADFSYWTNWGVEDETIPLSTGARQSVIDTFITYSYYRATAGYSTCTVELSTNTKALLTQDEIAQITAKGYTLA